MSGVKRLEIDLNVRVGRGMTFCGFEDVTPQGEVPEPGDVVNVGESESGAYGAAQVVSVDHERRLIYLSISWQCLSFPLDEDEMAALVERIASRRVQS